MEIREGGLGGGEGQFQVVGRGQLGDRRRRRVVQAVGIEGQFSW
jgi:hypothetical protein